MLSSVSISTPSENDNCVISGNLTHCDSVELHNSEPGVGDERSISVSMEPAMNSAEQTVSETSILSAKETNSERGEITPSTDSPSLLEPETFSKSTIIREESKSSGPPISEPEASSKPAITHEEFKFAEPKSSSSEALPALEESTASVDSTDDSTVNSVNIDEQIGDKTTLKVKKRKKFSPLDRLIIDDGKGKSKKKPKKEVELPKLKGEGDIFCWSCHKPGTFIAKCTRCFRVYHATHSCSYLEREVPENWICYECDLINEAIETEKNLPKKFDKESLNSLLLVATEQLAKYSGAEYFINPVDDPEFSDYKDYIYCPMSFSDIKDKISKNAYNNFYSFIIDLKYLIHNSYIYNTAISEITHIARTLLRKGSTFVEEIKSCPECVVNSIEDDGFTKACTEVHIPVWAKYKLYPYWPAKVIKFIKSENETLVQVKFFGAHNRADLPMDMIYLYSEKAPSKYLSKSKSHLNNYIKSREEMSLYIKNLAAKFQEFKYAPFDTKLKDKNLEDQIRIMLPKYPAKRITKVADMKLIKELNLSRKKTSLERGIQKADDKELNEIDQVIDNKKCENLTENDIPSKRRKNSTKPLETHQVKQSNVKKSIEEAKNDDPQDADSEELMVSDFHEKSQDESITSQSGDAVMKRKRGRPFKKKRGGRNPKAIPEASNDSEQIVNDDVPTNSEPEVVPAKRKRGRPFSQPFSTDAVSENEEMTPDFTQIPETSSDGPLKETDEDTSKIDAPTTRKRSRHFKASRPSSPQVAVQENKEIATKVTRSSKLSSIDEPEPIPNEAPAENTEESDVPVKRKRGRPFKVSRPISPQKSLKDEESSDTTDTKSSNLISKTRDVSPTLPLDSKHERLEFKSEADTESRSVSPQIRTTEALKLTDSSEKLLNTAKTKSLSPQGARKCDSDVKSRSMSPWTAAKVNPTSQQFLMFNSESELSLTDEDNSSSESQNGDVPLDDVLQYADTIHRRAVVVLERMSPPFFLSGKVKNSNSMEDLLSPNELQALKKKEKDQSKNLLSSNEMHALEANKTSKKPLVSPQEFQAYKKKNNLSRIELEALQEEMGFSSSYNEEVEESENEETQPQEIQNEQEECEEEQDSGSESDLDFLDPEKISYEDIMDLISKCKTTEQAKEYTIKAYKILSTFYATTTSKLTDQCNEELDLIEKVKDEYEQELSAKWHKRLEGYSKECDERFKIIKEMYKKRVKNTDRHRWCNVCHSIANIFCCYGTHYCSIECQNIHWNQEHHEQCHQHKITNSIAENGEVNILVEIKDRTLEECFILSEKLKERKREKAMKEKAEFVISSVMSLPPDEFSPTIRDRPVNEEFMAQPSTSRQFIDQPSTSRDYRDLPYEDCEDFRNQPSTSGLGRNIPLKYAVVDLSDASDSD